MTETAVRPVKTAARVQLAIEFAALFIGVPILMAVFFEDIQRNRALFPMVLALAGVALFLLVLTSGWRFRDLLRGPVLSEWRIILGFALISGLACVGFVWAINPQSFLNIVLMRPHLWLIIMVFYPLLSALPQEIIYRTLFFERYQVLFPGLALPILVNGAVFGFGHLFYVNWITISMTAIGGMVMGWAYLRGRSTLLSWVLHSLAGQLVFTSGLGQFFYHGAVAAG